MSGKKLRTAQTNEVEKLINLKTILNYPNVVKSINEGKFKQYVDKVRKFKRDNKIEGRLRDIIPSGVKGDIVTLANKFDIFIPISGVLERQKIDFELNALRTNKNKVYNKLNKDIVFPRADDLIEPDSSIGGATAEDVEREMKLKSASERDEDKKKKAIETQKELMAGVKRMKERLTDDIQEEGEPKLTQKEKEDIAKSIVDDVISESVDKSQQKEIEQLAESLIDDILETSTEDVVKQEKSKTIKDLMDTGLSEQEANEMFDKIEQDVATQVGRQMMMGQLEPQATAQEELMEGQEAVRQAQEERPTTGMSAEEEADFVGANPNLADVPSASTSVKDMKPSKGVELKVKKGGVDIQALPTKAELIPKIRLSSRGKDIKELLDDINYFLSNFKSQLKKEKDFFSKVDKKNINQLRELHGRIVGKLQPNLPARETDKKVGVVINADEYIREQMKRILNESTFSNLRPSDVVIDVGSRKAEGRDTKDFGDFEVKKTLDGGLAVQREAVYRYMPSENDDMVNEEGQTQRQRQKPNRLALPKSRLNNERTNAIRQTINNPFRRPQKTVKLKYLY